MTQAQREKLATPVVLVYWLLLTGGLLVYGALRLDDYASVMPLWLGAVGGTLLGQLLALRDFRMWIAAFVVLGATGLGMELVPPVFAGAVLWQAFVPAALCGFWSLGDRSVLAALWFPAVLWMLSILDRTDGTLAPDGTGVVLLSALAVLFIAFLRARESRRVALWRAVAAVPLAPVGPTELLRAPPASQLARAGWGLSISAITVAVTAWVVPPLWEVEPLAGEPLQIAEPAAPHGLPCCPRVRDAELESSRVKEYFDLGRGHDAQAAPSREGIDCRSCDGTGRWDDGEPGGPVLASGPRVSTPSPAPAPPGGGVWGAWRPGAVPAPIEEPDPQPTTTIPAAPAPAPVVVIDSTPLPEPSREAAMTSTQLSLSDRAPATPPPAAPLVEPAAVEPHIAPSPPAARPSGAVAGAPRRAGSDGVGPSLAHWLLLLGAGALIFQLVGLALRPLRRLITLRHLRHPFWDETIAQRVSNSWQLALVGLRDAGWRPGASEPPHELARRVGIDGLDRCATILERARHGIGIDAEDLGDMHASADVAYRAARRGVGGFARAVGWLRWPLA